MKIAIIDIDGVIADSIERFKQCTEGGKINWDRALSSELLHLDKLIQNAAENLYGISEHYDKTILLTSRYDHMRQASLVWLDQHNIVTYERAIFKPWNDRFVKTKHWKAQQVLKILEEHNGTTLLQSRGDPLTEVLIVEDEEANREEIQQEVGRWIMSNRQARARYSIGLQEAVRMLQADAITIDTDIEEME